MIDGQKRIEAELLGKRDRREALRDPKTLWTAMHCVPGCLPDGEPMSFLDWEDAIEALREDLETEAEAEAQCRDEAAGEDDELGEAEIALAALDAHEADSYGEPFAVSVGIYTYSVESHEPIDDEDARRAALAFAVDVPFSETEEAAYGDSAFEAEGAEYLVLTDDEADEAAAEYIRETLWAFNPEWLENYVPDGVDASILHTLQGERCEDANDAFLGMVGDRLAEMTEDAIAADGRGHFLSTYDGEELEAGGFFIYRTN